MAIYEYPDVLTKIVARGDVYIGGGTGDFLGFFGNSGATCAALPADAGVTDNATAINAIIALLKSYHLCATS